MVLIIASICTNIHLLICWNNAIFIINANELDIVDVYHFYHNDEELFSQQGDLHIVDSFKDIESERVS